MTVASSSVGSPTVVAPPGVAPPAVDEVFAQPLDRVDDFTFNEEVAGVFDDMVSRSVPQYAEIQRMLAELPARVPRWWPRLAGLRETFATTLFNWRRVLIKEYSAPLGWTLPIVLIGLWNIHQTTGLAQRPVAVAVLWTLLGTAALLWLTLGALKKTRVLALAEG